MKSIWTGTVAFGIVNVPIKVYSATEDHDIKLHQVHTHDGGRIRYKRVCETCGEEMTPDMIGKCAEHDGNQVMIAVEDLDSIKEDRQIEMVEFVPADAISPIMYEKTYYLGPDPKGGKLYALMRDVIAATEYIAIGKFTMRSKTRLGAVTARDNIMMLHALYWPDEIRVPELPGLTDIKTRPSEVRMANNLVNSLITTYDPGRHSDTYQEALRVLIASKKTSEPDDISDLIDKLEKSKRKRKTAA